MAHSLDLPAEIARLRALPVAASPAWAKAHNGLPNVVAALDVAWGNIKDAETGKQEEVAVACCAGFDVRNLATPLFVEFEPREGFVRGPFPPYEAGKLFCREGPRLLVPLLQRVVEAGEDKDEKGKGEEEENVETKPRLSPLLVLPKVDIFLIDGFGELHPERFGSACAIGAAGGAPTAGVSKNMLLLDGGASPSEEARKGTSGVKSGGGGHFLCPSAPGMETWPLGDDGAGNPLAVAMRPAGRSGGREVGEGKRGIEEAEASSSSSSSAAAAGRAAFVSAGHRVPLTAAARAVLTAYDPQRRFRLPEPSRAADRLARERLREELGKAR